MKDVDTIIEIELTPLQLIQGFLRTSRAAMATLKEWVELLESWRFQLEAGSLDYNDLIAQLEQAQDTELCYPRSSCAGASALLYDLTGKPPNPNSSFGKYLSSRTLTAAAAGRPVCPLPAATTFATPDDPAYCRATEPQPDDNCPPTRPDASRATRRRKLLPGDVQTRPYEPGPDDSYGEPAPSDH